MPEINLETKLTLIKFAIDFIEKARQDWIDANANPAIDSEVRRKYKSVIKLAEDEFGWQWRNVKDLIGEYERVRREVRGEIKK